MVGKTYSVAEARQNFVRLIRPAERGKAVETTRRGEPVAAVRAAPLGRAHRTRDGPPLRGRRLRGRGGRGSRPRRREAHRGAGAERRDQGPELTAGLGPLPAAYREFAELRTRVGTLRLLAPTECVMDRLAGVYDWDDRQCLDQAIEVARRHAPNLRQIESWSRGERFLEKFRRFRESLREEGPNRD